MQDLGPATDDQVILAWLQAEIESERFQGYYVGDPAALAFVREMAHNPDLTNPQQNAFRRERISGVRGFGRGTFLFAGLANDIVWRRAHVSIVEVGDMLYANHPTWRALAPRTLTVSEGATNVGVVPVPDDPSPHIQAIARDIRQINPVPTYPEIICLTRPDGRISVMEGHSRASAFVLEAHRLPTGVDIYLGDSASVATWVYL